MRRREFLTWLGIGVSALAIDPKTLISDPLEIYKDYPKLFFTGLKASLNSYQMAGQFLWTVNYKKVDGSSGITHWMCNAVVNMEDVNENSANLRPFIRCKLENCAMTVAHMMDGIIRDALNGYVQIAKWKQIPNPDFNPDLPATTAWDDDYEVWNPETINGEPIKERITSMAFGSYEEEGDFDAWDIERLTNQCMVQLRLK